MAKLIGEDERDWKIVSQRGRLIIIDMVLYYKETGRKQARYGGQSCRTPVDL